MVIIEKLDIAKDVTDWQSLPLDYEAESVKEIICTGVIEYLPGKMRGQFMDELYRILSPGGKISIAVIYWNSDLAFHDYRFEFPPLAPQSFLMFNKKWREDNLKNVDLKCDFNFDYGYINDEETDAKNTETQAFYWKHYTNSIKAIQLVLTKV